MGWWWAVAIQSIPFSPPDSIIMTHFVCLLFIHTALDEDISAARKSHWKHAFTSMRCYNQIMQKSHSLLVFRWLQYHNRLTLKCIMTSTTSMVRKKVLPFSFSPSFFFFCCFVLCFRLLRLKKFEWLCWLVCEYFSSSIVAPNDMSLVDEQIYSALFILSAHHPWAECFLRKSLVFFQLFASFFLLFFEF